MKRFVLISLAAASILTCLFFFTTGCDDASGKSVTINYSSGYANAGDKLFVYLFTYQEGVSCSFSSVSLAEAQYSKTITLKTDTTGTVTIKNIAVGNYRLCSFIDNLNTPDGALNCSEPVETTRTLEVTEEEMSPVELDSFNLLVCK